MKKSINMNIKTKNTKKKKAKLLESNEINSDENPLSIANGNAVCSTLSPEIHTGRSFMTLEGSISTKTMDAIKKMGFKNMTEIQEKAIPKLLEGIDLRGTAKTGSGKSLAFLIPAIELMNRSEFYKKRETGVIIVSPTRELALQLHTVLKKLLDMQNITCGTLIGGFNMRKEASSLKKGINIIVATPGRLLEHMKNTKFFKFSDLRCLIMDEADMILSSGFEREMRQILELLPKKRQTMLFSATKEQKVNKLASIAFKSDKLVKVDVAKNKAESTAEGVKQFYLKVSMEEKFRVLCSFIKKQINKKIMVFVSTCRAVMFYNDVLNHFGAGVNCIHGRKKQGTRTATFFQFHSAESGVLLCTDVAARGWDIPAVDWIVQFDPPGDPTEYIHRVGRTARAGKKGNALLLLTAQEMGFISHLKTQFKVTIDSLEAKDYEAVPIQPELEKLISNDSEWKIAAEKAFKSFFSYYHSNRSKEGFDYNSLDTAKVGKCFGLNSPPEVELKNGKKRGRNGQKRPKNRANKKQKTS